MAVEEEGEDLVAKSLTSNGAVKSQVDECLAIDFSFRPIVSRPFEWPNMPEQITLL